MKMNNYIVEISCNQKTEWDKAVRSFENYDVFYLNDYVCAFRDENPKNGEPILLVYNNKEDCAINVVFKRDIAEETEFKFFLPKGKYYDLVSPYGYGGFIGEITDYVALNAAYNDYCISQRYICEFVRFELFTDYATNYDGEVECRTHNVVRSLDMTLDEIWMDFKQKVRKNVKKANSNHLEIVIENTDEHLQDFLDIYYSTMERSNAESEYYFSKAFFEILNRMSDNIMYFHVIYEGKVISTELVIYGAENCYSYLGGTNREYFELRPNDFLKYEIIKWAKEKGLKNFVLGGGYGADDGIFKYKACLAPRGVVNFYIGRKVFDKKTYDYLVEYRKKLDKPMKKFFFPEYRA